jgi:hypothetical protein
VKRLPKKSSWPLASSARRLYSFGQCGEVLIEGNQGNPAWRTLIKLTTRNLPMPVGLSQMKAKVSYKFSRLCFKADLIEPLGESDSFCVDTPEGPFLMTKREFYRFFSNVVQTRSYRDNRIYHYPRTPQKALPFLV